MVIKTVFSGIQPTGVVHLGNYMGAISNWVDLQNNSDYQCIFSIVNLHALTVSQDPKDLHVTTLSLLASLLACGIDVNKSLLFAQSSVKAHTELTWILCCVARIGWLNRMIQFKDKAGSNKEASSVGLYVYPVLMAADILLYDTDLIPVGEDQKQHIELIRDIALKFNKDYNTTAFKIPEPIIILGNSRVMSLKDGSKKMSKSDPSEHSRILITDSNDTILNKILKAKTDTAAFPTNYEDLTKRIELLNLVKIYTFCSNKLGENQNILQILQEFANKNFSSFKYSLVEKLVGIISPIREKYSKLIQDKVYLNEVYINNAQKAEIIANKKIQEIKNIIGLI